MAVECANVIVTSYNVLRTDADVLGGQVRGVPAECVHVGFHTLVVLTYIHERKSVRKPGRMYCGPFR